MQCRFYWTIVVYITFCKWLTKAHDLENNCINQWLSLNKRFSMEQIKWMCKQSSAMKLARKAPLMDTVQLTDRQAAYIDFIRHCQPNECQMKFASDQEEQTTETDPESDPRCKLRVKKWRPKFCDIKNHPACKQSGKQAKFCNQSPKNNRGKRSTNTSNSVSNADESEMKMQKRQTVDLSVRKEYRSMSDAERDAVHFAMNKLKKEKVDQSNKWDIFTSFHYPQQAPAAHWGPAFLPWHRELLRQVEVALKSEHPDFNGLPYWDSTMDYGLPDMRDSILWTPTFMGNGNGFVKEGPFESWPTLTSLENQTNVNNLYRDVGASTFGGLMRKDDINWIMNRTDFGQLSACVDPTFELLHGLPHIYVGGFMQIIRISPNDPIFYLHHTYIDYLWEQFRQQRQSPQQRVRDWAPSDKLCDDAHKIDAPMSPFQSMRNRDGLADTYTQKWYKYEQTPTCGASNPDCGSPYLWCDLRESQCKSKIRRSGNCTGLRDTNSCFQSACTQNFCSSSLQPTEPVVFPTRPFEITEQPIIINIVTEPQTQPFTQPFTQPNKPVTLPPGSYQTIGTQAPSTGSTVYLKTVLIDENGGMTSGTIQVEGVNYKDVSTFSPITDFKYPEYPGITYIEMKDPKLSVVTAKVTAYDKQGKECRAYCAQGYYKDIYVPCLNQITLSSQDDYSNPIPFTSKSNIKRFLNADMSLKPSSWSVHAPYMGFLCGSETNAKRFKQLADSVKPDTSTSDHLWFHVLVLDGRVPYHRSVPGSKVQVKSLNNPSEVFEAKVPEDTVFPHYFGVAPVKVKNPDRSSNVKASVRAFDPSGKECTPTCPGSMKSYVRCQGVVSLSNNSNATDVFAFSSDDDMKDFLNWDLSGHPNQWRRMISNLQLIC